MDELERIEKFLATHISATFSKFDELHLTSAIKQTDALGKYIELKLTNKAIGKSLGFHFSPPNPEHPEKQVFFFFLEYKLAFRIYLDDFIKYKKLPLELINSLSLHAYDGPFEDRIQNVLYALKEFFLSDLTEYVFTQHWETIPVPDYWMGLK